MKKGDSRMTIAKGRQPNEKPVFPEGLLEAVVVGDKRIKKTLIPAADGIRGAITFNAFQALRAEFPDASVDEILGIWKSRLDQAGDAYASKLTDHLQGLHDDFMAVARLRSPDDRGGIPQKVGLGPTTEERASILGSFVNRLTAFRGGGWSRDPEGLTIIESLRLWARANRPIFTKTAAFNLWHKKLRFRERYKDLQAAVVAQERKERIEEVAKGDYRKRIERLSEVFNGIVPLGWPHKWVKGMWVPLLRHRGKRIKPKPTMKEQDETHVTPFDRANFKSDMGG
jgi:hypothetical protein